MVHDFFLFFFYIHLSFSVFQNLPSSTPLTLDQCVIKCHNEIVCVCECEVFTLFRLA